MSSGYRSDLTGRVLGAISFLVGVGLLGVVFYLAYGLFHTNAEQALGLTFTGNPKLDPPAMKVGIQFGWLLGRIAVLFLMAIAGSFMSQRGVNFYFSASRGAAQNVVPGTGTPPPSGEFPAP